MQSPIEFYFDFSSPFGYLGAQQIEAIAGKHNREVIWKPIVLGFIFKTTQSKPIIEIPLKGEYTKHDLERSARELGIEYTMPTPFPINSITAARAVLWSNSNATSGVSEQATALIHALFKAYYVQGKDISQAEEVINVAHSVGIDRDTLTNALQDDKVKALLKNAIEEALDKNVFGSPFMIVDSEPFWGSDRLNQLDRWLDVGGW